MQIWPDCTEQDDANMAGLRRAMLLRGTMPSRLTITVAAALWRSTSEAAFSGGGIAQVSRGYVASAQLGRGRLRTSR